MAPISAKAPNARRLSMGMTIPIEADVVGLDDAAPGIFPEDARKN
jgi:hypothetical protein